MKSIDKLFDLIYMLRKVCKINYDGDQCMKKNKMPESRSRFHWKFESSSEVRMFIRSSVEIDREVQELAKEACRNSLSGSSQVQEFVRSPSEHHRGFVGCSPEVHRKLAGIAINAPEQIAL